MRKLLIALGCALVVTGCAPSTANSADRPAPSPISAASSEPASGDPNLCPAEFGAPDTSVSAGKRLPDVTLTCLTAADKTLKLDGAPGVPTLVNFWAAWCAPCRTEMPILQEFYTAAAGKVQVLGVVTSDTRSAGASFVADEQITFPNLLDTPGEVVKKTGLMGLPNSILIDTKGKIVGTHVGPFKDGAELRATVEKELGVDIQ